MKSIKKLLKREKENRLMPFDNPKVKQDTTNKQIFVTWQKEGIHQYPGAPEGVEFLQYPHRHMFHFRVEIDVFHNDRDIEFILLKRELEALYDEKTLQLDYKSCEMMADDLADYINKNYPKRDLVIEVSEDNENGAQCFYPKEL